MTALLAFDTATETMCVALQRDARVWLHEAPGGAKASASLLPAILDLLGQAGMRVADLDAIAFGRGPGAFTGLRTACAVAQGLALGAGRPVLPIDTLLAVAVDAQNSDADECGGGSLASVWVAMDARMNEIYAARAVCDARGWRLSVAPYLTDAAALNARWAADPPSHVAGSALSAFGDSLVTAAARRSPNALPRGTALLRLADAAWRAGAAVDAAQALPLYVRDKVAQTTAERDAAKAAAAGAAAGVDVGVAP